MKRWNHKAEIWLEQYGYWIIRYRWVVIALVLTISILMASQLRHIRMDTSLEAHLDPRDPAMKTYQEFRDRFGNDEVILVGIATENVFTYSFLKKLKQLHQELEKQTPYLEDIMSLANARVIRGEENQLIVGEFLENLPEDQPSLNQLQDFALHNPNYLNRVIAPDSTFTTIVITANRLAKFEPEENDNPEMPVFGKSNAKDSASPYGTYQPALTKKQTAEVVNGIRQILNKYNNDDFKVYFSGNPVVTEYLGKRMGADMGRFMGGGLLLTFVLLFILFRRVSGIVLPFTVVLLGVLLSISLMAVLGVSLKSSTVILPSFLLAVGISDSVHFLAIFYRFLSQGMPKDDAIAATLRHSGKPIIYTSITTAAGLWALSISKVALVAELGIFAGNGVIICLLISMVLLPTLVSVMPIRPQTKQSAVIREQRLDRILAGIGDIGAKHPGIIIGGAVLVLLFSVAGISRLRFAHDVLTWLPSSSDVRKDTEMIDKRMGGTITIEMLVDTGEENGLYQPDILNSLDQVADYLRGLKDDQGNARVGNVFSPADMIKEIHYALNAENPEAWKIPEERKTIAQEFFLFENSGSNDLESLMDIRFSMARLTARIPWMDVSRNNQLIEAARTEADRRFGPDTKITFTGMTSLFAKIGHETMISMRNSYFIAGVVIALLMCLLLSSIKWGLISMIPNLLPIIVTLGLMGWLNIPVDVFTMTIGSIAIGLCVDDTIHFMHKFFDYHRQTGDVSGSVHITLTTTGRAMLFTSLVLFACFMIYTAASLSIVIYFGVLIAITIIFALLADMLLFPALLQVLMKDKAV